MGLFGNQFYTVVIEHEYTTLITWIRFPRKNLEIVDWKLSVRTTNITRKQITSTLLQIVSWHFYHCRLIMLCNQSINQTIDQSINQSITHYIFWYWTQNQYI